MRTLLVTGAAGGVGKAVVERARDRGYMVVAAARGISQLSDVAEERVLPIAMDVSNTDSVSKAFADMDALLMGRPLDAVVHCAAVAPLGTVEFTPPDEYARILNINTLGAVRVAQQSLQRMRGRGGRLILVSSMWGRVSSPLLSNYSASKHAVAAIADSLRREVAGSGISVTVLEPGAIKTKMFTGQAAAAATKVEALSGVERSSYLPLYKAYSNIFESGERMAITAEKCADTILRVLDAKRPPAHCLVGIDAKLIVGLVKWLPDRAVDAIFRKML